MKVNPTSNVVFRADLRGEVDKVIRISKAAGLKDAAVKKAMAKIHEMCPKKDDRVYFYFRKYEVDPDFPPMNPVVRSGVKVFKDGKIFELNIDPRKISQKSLLSRMVKGVSDLLSGKKASEDTAIKYDTLNPRSWVSDFNDVENKDYKVYISAFKSKFMRWLFGQKLPGEE